MWKDLCLGMCICCSGPESRDRRSRDEVPCFAGDGPRSRNVPVIEEKHSPSHCFSWWQPLRMCIVSDRHGGSSVWGGGWKNSFSDIFIGFRGASRWQAKVTLHFLSRFPWLLSVCDKSQIPTPCCGERHVCVGTCVLFGASCVSPAVLVASLCLVRVSSPAAVQSHIGLLDGSHLPQRRW